MKRLIFALALVLIATNSFAWTLSWNAVTGSSGYRISYKTLAATTYTTIDNGTAVSRTLDNLSLVAGTRYEFYVQAYVGTTTRSYSGESDHVRWTYPAAPIIVEMQGQPVNILIQP